MDPMVQYWVHYDLFILGSLTGCAFVCLDGRNSLIWFFWGGPESAPKLSVSRFRIRSILPNLPNFDWILGSLSAFRGIPRSAAFPQELTQKLEDLNTAATEKAA